MRLSVMEHFAKVAESNSSLATVCAELLNATLNGNSKGTYDAEFIMRATMQRITSYRRALGELHTLADVLAHPTDYYSDPKI